MILFGISTKRHVIGLYHLFCHTCNVTGVHQGVLEKRAFTLFFLPFIPLGSSKRLICNRCGMNSKTKKFPEEYAIPLDQVLRPSIPPYQPPGIPVEPMPSTPGQPPLAPPPPP